jgi:UrcA family protein
MLKQFIISSFALAAVVVAAPAVQAQELPSVKVSLAGIDTRSDSGALIAVRRIQTAAGKVCGGEPSAALDRQQKFEPCVREVTQRTVSGLNNPRIAAMLEHETGVPAPKPTLASAR